MVLGTISDSVSQCLRGESVPNHHDVDMAAQTLRVRFAGGTRERRVTTDIEPRPELDQVFALQFRLLRWVRGEGFAERFTAGRTDS